MAAGARTISSATTMAATGGPSGTGATPPSTGSKGPPNPYGKKGGPEHQAKVAEVADDIRARGLRPRFEYRVLTPSGSKGSRYVDVIAEDDQGRVVEMHQVGRQTKAGFLSRENRALNDIEGATGVRPKFHPYNNIR
jgi:hypothetical protein